MQHPLSRRWGARSTATPAGVACPRCGGAELVVRASCLATWLACPDCSARLDLADLASHLDDETFERLARLVGDRLSDRV